MKPLALDLCCGKGGWTRGLLAAGYDVIGFDIEAWAGYAGTRMVVGDVRQVNGAEYLAGGGVTLVTASPPCQEFSKLGLPFFAKLRRSGFQPDKSIWEACVRIAKEAKAPLILENVRNAQPYMGKAVARYGAYYLWGDVPLMLPMGNPRKGFGNSIALYWKDAKAARDKLANLRGDSPAARKEHSANIAMIPDELGLWIGKCFHPDGH